MKVAPLFKHGIGVASTGGVAGTRIVFFPEDDAMKVIAEELDRAGVAVAKNSLTLPKMDVPVTHTFLSFGAREKSGNRSHKIPVSRPKDLLLDGTEAKRKISVEYVSETDFRDWEDKSGSESTVTRYDLTGTAKVLRDGWGRWRRVGGGDSVRLG